MHQVDCLQHLGLLCREERFAKDCGVGGWQAAQVGPQPLFEAWLLSELRQQQRCGLLCSTMPLAGWGVAWSRSRAP